MLKVFSSRVMTVLSSPRKLFLVLAEIRLQEVTSAVTRLLVGQAPLLVTKTPAKRYKLVLVGHVELCCTAGQWVRKLLREWHAWESRKHVPAEPLRNYFTKNL